MNTITKRRAALICAVLAAGVVIAACGSTGSTTTSTVASTGSGASGSGRFAAFRSCLKAHGVNLPARRPGTGPGPGAGGPPGGFFEGGGALANNPKLAAAVKACGGRNFRGARRSRLSRAAITSYVACVRQHGYNLPNPNFSGNGPVFPSSIRSDPKFQAASRACQNLLIRPRTGTSTTVRS